MELWGKMEKKDLFPEELLRSLPPLESTSNLDDTQILVRAKYYYRWESWRFYVTEYDPEKRLLRGLIDGLCFFEWGDFTLNELESKHAFGESVERDTSFTPITVAELRKQRIKRRYGKIRWGE